MSAPAGAATWVARHNGEFVGYADGRRQFAERSDVAAAAAAENNAPSSVEGDSVGSGRNLANPPHVRPQP